MPMHQPGREGSAAAGRRAMEEPLGPTASGWREVSQPAALAWASLPPFSSFSCHDARGQLGG